MHRYVYLRQCADALGGVSDVPDFDVSGGNSEDQAGRIPKTKPTTTILTKRTSTDFKLLLNTVTGSHLTETTLLG